MQTYRVILVCVLAGVWSVQAQIPVPENPQWVPVPDNVFLQEQVELIPTDEPLRAAAVFEGIPYFGDVHGVRRLEGRALEAAGGPAAEVRRLRVIAGALWAVVQGGLWRFDGTAWSQVTGEPVVDLCAHGGDVVAVTAEGVFRLHGGTLVPMLAQSSPLPILGVQSYSETIYVRHENALGFVTGDRLEYYEVEDWNQLPIGSVTRDMWSFGNHITVATSKGLGELRGASWHLIQGAQGLPVEDTTCVVPGFDRDYWVGTARGAARFTEGAFQYFGEGRWLPHGRVNAIATGDRVVYLATEGGLAVIRYVPFTLQKKAAWYKRYLQESGMIRLGIVTVLTQQPDGSYRRFLGDNDFGWTCHYLNGLCFEYAVTRDPAVRAEAVDIFKSIKWSEEITPIPGYPARAIHAIGEDTGKTDVGSAGRPAEWNATPDGRWEWKGDNSSEEVVAQPSTVSLFHDLVAEGIEKEKAVEHLERMIGHIVDHGWRLIDLDGQPTVWAQWDPDFVYSPDHVDERGLNSLQALSFTAIARRLFPSDRFAAAHEQLIAWNYLDNVLRQKRTFPHYTRFDDRLAFLAFYPLLRYETDPAVRAPVMRSLQRSWEIKRIEKQTWFNFIYGALTGNDCETEAAVDHLRSYPLDCFSYPYTNSHRDDLQNPEGYINYLEDWKPLTPRDVGWQRWNRSFQQLDGGGGMGAQDPSGWLDAYWMGRYYGMIEGPKTTEDALLTVEHRDDIPKAAPYTGPERPPIF